MNEKISWYFEQKNNLLGDNVLAICYQANDEEIKQNGLTSNNLLLLIKNQEFKRFCNSKNLDIVECLRSSFKNKIIFMRIQCECLLGIYGDSHCDCEHQKGETLKIINEREGIYIHLPQEAQGHGLHYKLKELELQVNGRDTNGKFVGYKDRNDAQKLILNKEKFEDKRSYKIIVSILKELGLDNNQFVLITDNKKKIKELQDLGLKTEAYDDYVDKHVDLENASEYLVKILEETCVYDKSILKEIMALIKSRKYNERTINTFLKIVEKINTDAIECLDAESKKMFLDTYNSIICGVEKVYTFNDSNITKVQNKFSCKVNNRIFGALKLVFRENIFNRISSETSYFFYNIKENYSIRIRHSKVLDIKDGNSLYLRGQEYLQQTIFLNDKTKLVENEITKSKLKTYFENKDFLYNKKMDTIAFISEGELDGVSVYVKRVPNVENHIMDVYGKKEKILKFINSITTISDKTVLNMISNIQLEDEDLFDSNLSFGDKNTAIEEELMIYKLLNNE